MNKLIFLTFIFMILPVLSVHNFVEQDYPEEVPIGSYYYFSTRNIQEVELKCYLMIYDSNSNMIDKFVGEFEKCNENDGIESCKPSVLFTDSNGYMSYGFFVNPDKYLVGNTYEIVTQCGSETDDSYYFFVRESNAPNFIFNWALIGIENSTSWVWLMLLSLLLITIMIILVKMFWELIRNFLGI